MEKDPGPRRTSWLELAGAITIAAVVLVLIIPSIIEFFAQTEKNTVVYNLGTLRTALAAYYSDNQKYPMDDLQSLVIDGKYLSEIPLSISNPVHPPTHRVTAESEPSDVGGWSYNNNPDSASFGSVHVACTHQGSRGVVWSTY